MRPPLRSRLTRWYFLIPAAIVVIGLVVPLSYLILRATDAQPDRIQSLVLNARNFRLLSNTLLLAAGVLAAATLISFPLAWLASSTDLRPRALFTTVGMMPLAVPGYVMAYVILGTTGSYGTLARIFGVETGTLSGYWGALVALTLYTSPYLFLSLRAAMLRADPSLEETARSLGCGKVEVFLRVTLPQLRAAYLAGALLVLLHVMGDFGVVSLMRFETFSFAIYLQFAAAFDRTYAALLALMLLTLTAALLIAEARLLRSTSLARTGSGAGRSVRSVELGRWKPAAAAAFILFGVVSIGVPLATITAWMSAAEWHTMGAVTVPLWNAVTASVPSALLATAIAVPIAYMSVRFPSRTTRGMERLSYFGYAVPPLALALAYIFFALSALPALYQTLSLLIAAYTMHFLAEAIGPVRSAIMEAPRNVEEAARSLGRTPLRAFAAATLPLLRTGIVVSVAFVFLSAVKELPLTILLSPPGFETLAVNVWSYTNDAMFGRAAPYALAIVAVSALFVGLLLSQEVSKSPHRPSLYN